MDFHDPADIIALVNRDTHQERLAIYAPDQVARRGVRRQVNAQVRVYQEHVLNRYVLTAAALDGPRIRDGRVAGHLVRIVNRHSFQGGIVALQGDERTAVGGAGAIDRQQGGAERLRGSRRRPPDADQAGLCRDHQGGVNEVVPWGRNTIPPPLLAVVLSADWIAPVSSLVPFPVALKGGLRALM